MFLQDKLMLQPMPTDRRSLEGRSGIDSHHEVRMNLKMFQQGKEIVEELEYAVGNSTQVNR